MPHFLSRLGDPSPGFLCCPPGKQHSNRSYLARLRHVLCPPIGGLALRQLTELLPTASPTLLPIYRMHDGLILYADQLSDTAAIELYPIENWERATLAMREWITGSGLEPDQLTPWQMKGIAVGEIPHSGNYLVLDPDDSVPGRIFHQDHDGFEEEPIASNLEDLLDSVTADPVAFIMKSGCYARYSDGMTETQWIPMQYIPDTRIHTTA